MDFYQNAPPYVAKRFKNDISTKYLIRIMLFDGTSHWMDQRIDYDIYHMLNYYLKAPDVLYVEFGGFRIYSLNTLNDLCTRRTADNT